MSKICIMMAIGCKDVMDMATSENLDSINEYNNNWKILMQPRSI